MYEDYRVAKMWHVRLRGWLLRAFAAVLLPALAGCVASAQTEPALDKRCQDPRPQMCTLEYMPVCGYLGNDEWREYSNGCSACADSQVIGYVSGVCPPADP